MLGYALIPFVFKLASPYLRAHASMWHAVPLLALLVLLLNKIFRPRRAHHAAAAAPAAEAKKSQ